MMKKIMILLTLSFFCAGILSAQKLTIRGKMKLAQTVEKIYLSFRSGEISVLDSAVLKKGKFSFTEEIKEPLLASLRVRFAADDASGKRQRTGSIPVFIEPGKMQIEVKDSLQSARISGSVSQKSFEAFNKLVKPYNEKSLELSKQYAQYAKDKDEQGMKKISDQYQQMTEEKSEKVFHTYLVQNPRSPIAMYVLEQYAGYDIDPQKVEPVFELLPATTRNLPSAIAFSQRIATAKKTAVGAYAMDFTQNDTLGNPVSLSAFRGKYVLVDFWASWCGPCRAENPNVVRAYGEYKDRNFTVLSVSLDQPGKKQAWLDAIHKDGLTWTHVSDLKFWNNAVAKQYGIRAIPQNVLLDPTGKIIAKNIRGEALDKKLQEIFK